MNHTTMTTNVFNFTSFEIHITGALALIVYQTPAGSTSVLPYPGRTDREPTVLAVKASQWFDLWKASEDCTFDEPDLLEEGERVAS